MSKETISKTKRRQERAKRIFISCKGDIDKAMRHSKMPYKRRSTVMKLANQNNWYLDVNNSQSGSGALKKKHEGDETIIKLKALRKILFGKITGQQFSESSDQVSLKLEPKTLSEAIKALIDIDKRISEREANVASKDVDLYKNILARCAEFKEND